MSHDTSPTQLATLDHALFLARQKADALADTLLDLRRELDLAQADTRRLDWIDRRRVVVMRCGVHIHDDAWKVETMDGHYIRADLRAAIDRAMETSNQPEED